MSKITIDYDPVLKIGAVYHGDVQLCDLNMEGWQANMIDELVKEHIAKGIEKCQQD